MNEKDQQLATHKCSEFPDPYHEFHYYGAAIGSIRFHPALGRWVADNGDGEYGTYIRFCPFCGLNLPSIAAKREGAMG